MAPPSVLPPAARGRGPLPLRLPFPSLSLLHPSPPASPLSPSSSLAAQPSSPSFFPFASRPCPRRRSSLQRRAAMAFPLSDSRSPPSPFSAPLRQRRHCVPLHPPAAPSISLTCWLSPNDQESMELRSVSLLAGMDQPLPSIRSLHSGIAVTGFCPTCLRERLANLRPPASHLNSTDLRRCRSFSYGRSAAAYLEPQRRSCDGCGTLFHQELLEKVC